MEKNRKSRTELAMAPGEAVRRMIHDRVGPFSPFFRVACPERNFGYRLSLACAKCSCFSGVKQLSEYANPEETDPRIIQNTYKIACSHPVARAARFFPED